MLARFQSPQREWSEKKSDDNKTITTKQFALSSNSNRRVRSAAVAAAPYKRSITSSTGMKAIRDIGTSGAVKLRGWVRTIRRHKNVSFIELNDGSTFSNLQVVAAGKGPLQPIVDELSVGCSVELAGEVSVHRGNVELQLTALDVTGTSPVEEYPLQKKHHSLEFLRQHPHLRARTKTIGGALRVRHELSRGLRSFFDDRDFIGISTPVMTPSDCEVSDVIINYFHSII